MLAARTDDLARSKESDSAVSLGAERAFVGVECDFGSVASKASIWSSRSLKLEDRTCEYASGAMLDGLDLLIFGFRPGAVKGVHVFSMLKGHSNVLHAAQDLRVRLYMGMG